MSDVLGDLLVDLQTEGDQLAAVVDQLGESGWRAPTPAEGWGVATTVAHLAWTDQVATLAARWLLGPEQKTEWDTVVLSAIDDPAHFVDRSAADLAAAPRDDVLATWTDGRRRLREALLEVTPGQRLPWFGPPMSPTSMATARFMETWAHGLDVYDAAGRLIQESRPEPTDRIRHVAHLGVRTRDFAYTVHGEPPPTDPFRLELVAPSGATWAWGPEDAVQRITGSAYDFCLLVTQRVHRADTDLVAAGADVDHWLDIAQAFAGTPGEGRPARG